MGNRSSNSNPRIGQVSSCPNCGRSFPASTTYSSLHHHIDNCLQQQQQQHQEVFHMNQEIISDDYIWIKVNGAWQRVKSHVNGGVIQNYSVQQIKSCQFSEKQVWFKMQLEKRRIPWQMGSDKLMINLNNLLESSLDSAVKVNMYKEVKVVFENDKVQDAGGLLREWLTLLFKDLCVSVFSLCETEDVLYKINHNSSPYYTLVGLAIGKALFERMTISVEFDRPLIKRLLGQEVSLNDMLYFDKGLYQSWKYLLENHIDPDLLQQYFIVCKDEEIMELRKDGADILVTNENKDEFVAQNIQYFTNDSIRTQLTQIQTALYKYIPPEFLSIFSAEEFEMLLYGVPIVDLNEWKQQTQYQHPYNQNSSQIQWFWKILSEFDQDQLKKFLHYCTGSYRIPVTGFSKLESNRGQYAKFMIKPLEFKNENCFPIAHTCFNRLELPKYPKEDMMRKCLRGIVLNDLEGIFGME